MNAAIRAAARGWILPLLALPLVFVAGPARAQDLEPSAVRNWSAKLGVYFPTQGTMRNQTDVAWWAVGVDYDPHFTHRILDGDVFFSADLFIRDSQSTTTLIVPLLANIVWNITPPETQHRVYGGVGVGAYYINPRYLGSTTQAGARFILGADVTDRVYVQLNYDWVGGFNDNLGNSVRADGLSALAGFRF